MRIQVGEGIQLSHFSYLFSELFRFCPSGLGFAQICHPRQDLTLALRQRELSCCGSSFGLLQVLYIYNY